MPGVPTGANYAATNSEIQPSLGRPLSSGTSGVVPIVAPNTMFEDRHSQLDVRFSKIVRIGRSRLQGSFDIYNLTNASTIVGSNQTYGANWLVPTAVGGGRLVKFEAQIDFWA